jgi:hypothetical protein
VTIGILHWLIEYFKNKFTVKKTKNMGEMQMKKYREILDEITTANVTNVKVPFEDAQDFDVAEDAELKEFALQCLQ